MPRVISMEQFNITKFSKLHYTSVGGLLFDRFLKIMWLTSIFMFPQLQLNPIVSRDFKRLPLLITKLPGKPLNQQITSHQIKNNVF